MSFEATGFEPETIDGVYRSRTGINYTNLFFYEKKFFNQDYVNTKRDWMSQNWQLSIVYAFFYIVAVFAGQWYMKSREKFDLRKSLIAWNFVLALFSIIGAVRVWPEFVYTILNNGVEHSICSNDYTYGVSGCWAWLFILSKVPELGDTLFIVLRKQPLIFLHWYHHATVLVYCWFSCRDFTASGRWFIVMNYTVHSVMYLYYGFRALRFNIPKWVNIVITSGQISQMIFGIYVNTIAYYKKQRGESCDVSNENIKWSFIMYFTYFVLFFHFFYEAYLAKPKRRTTTKQQANGHHHHQNGKLNGHHTNGHINGNNQQHLSNGDTKKTE